MIWKIEDGIIKELIFDNKNIIKPWGFETADSSAFFSLEKDFGYRYKIISKNSFSDSYVNEGTLHVVMKEGSWLLRYKDEILNKSIIKRVYKITCLEDTFFMDFVTRFRFKKKFFVKAEIANKSIFHKNSNIYHQFPVSFVKLFSYSNENNIEINIVNKEVPDGMSSYMYVRDNKDEWIIHARMLPNRFDKVVIKLCNEWFKTRPIPIFLSKILLSNQKVKNALWYRGEKSNFSNKLLRFINPAAFPMVKLKKGTVLKWDLEIKINE